MRKNRKASKVAIIVGGLSSEREVSLDTGKAFSKALTELNISFEVIDAAEDLPVKLFQQKPDIALLALHGQLAEDGTVQGICEYLKIPYSGSGVLGSALAMNKAIAKKVFVSNSIPTPKGWFIDLSKKNSKKSPNLDKISKEIKGSFVVKPARDGSSMGISICSKVSELEVAVELAGKYDPLILIEEYISGKEVTVPILKGKALTSIEIEPKDGYYDYKNKYTKGKTNYFLPARLSAEQLKNIEELAIRAFESIDARNYGRVDFRIKEDGSPYVLEVNTLPGCTETSLVPKSAASMGISFSAFVKELVDSARLDYEVQS